MPLPPDVALIIASLLAALSVGSLVIVLFYSRMAGPSKSRKRFEAIAALGAPSGRQLVSEESNRKRIVEITLRELEEKRKAKGSSKLSLIERMRQAGLSWSRQAYYLACAIAGGLCFLVALGAFGFGPVPALGFGMTGGLLLPHFYVSARCGRRLKGFANEFPNAVDVIVRGVKAGLPIGDCMRIISIEAQEPVRGEFKTLIEDQTLGMPVDQAVQRLSERVPLPEASFFAIVIAMQSRTGGSLSEALGNLSKVLRERKKMQAKIKAMSSEAKASAAIIGSLPVVVTVLLYLTSPDYIMLLFTTLIGHLVLVACGLWMGIGVLVMRKMINFDF